MATNSHGIDDNITTLYFEDITCEDTDDEPPSIQSNEAAGVVFDAEVNKYEEKKNKNINLNKKSSNTWVSKELAACPREVGGGATITNVKGKLYVFGGCGRSGEPSASLMRYDLDSNEWTELSCSGSAPTARFGHTAVAHNSFLYIFGGQGLTDKDGKSLNKAMPTSYNDTYCLDTISLTWSVVDANKTESSSLNGKAASTAEEDDEGITKPYARNSHTAVVINKKMVIFGGANAEVGPMNDVWALDLMSHKWESIEFASDNVPDKREMHTACTSCSDLCRETSSRMYVMGGRREDGNVCQDLWEFDLSNFVWCKLASPSSPRCSHGAVVVAKHECLCYVGGWDGQGTVYDDLVVYDFQHNEWKEVQLNAKPAQRFGHTCCVINKDRFAVFGGVNAISDLDDLHVISKL